MKFPSFIRKTDRVLIGETIKLIDEEENPYLWVTAYCLYKGHTKINQLEKILHITIGDWNLHINGKPFKVTGIGPLGIEVHQHRELEGLIFLDDCSLPADKMDQLQQAMIDTLLDDLKLLQPI